MPKFKKSLDELKTRFDKWLYVLKNLNFLDRIPPQLKEQIFEKLFAAAEIAKFNQEQYLSYEGSLKYYLDLKNSLDTAREEGEIKGAKLVRTEIAKNLLLNGVSIELVIKTTGLTGEEIEELK